MKSLELYDILTLEDNLEYIVGNMTTYNDGEYLYLIQVDKDENPIETNQKVVKRVISDGSDALELVTDKEELQEVTKIFFNSFKEMAEEENINEN